MVTFTFQKPLGLPLLSTNIIILSEARETFIPVIIYQLCWVGTTIDFFFNFGKTRWETSWGMQSSLPPHPHNQGSVPKDTEEDSFNLQAGYGIGSDRIGTLKAWLEDFPVFSYNPI